MDKLKERLQALRAQYNQLSAQVSTLISRLSEQEKIVALGALVVLSTLSFVFITYSLVTTIDRSSRQITYKSEQLREIIAAREMFRRAQDQNAAFRARLQRNDIRLVALLEEESKKMGIEFGNMNPHADTEPSAAGIKTQMVDLRATKLSADKLVNFLQRLEEQPSPVRVVKLKLNLRYDEKDLIDAEMTVATYKAS